MNTDPSDLEQERDKLRIRIFSSVAHDLKTPLACIIGSLDALDQMSHRLSDEQRKTLAKTALSEALKLDVFISEMLEKAKP